MGFRTGVVRTVVGLDRETQASYRLVIEAIGEFHVGVKQLVMHVCMHVWYDLLQFPV